MKWLRRSTEQLTIIGVGLVTMALVMVSLPLSQPSDSAWILVYILKPVPYFITAGVALALGLFLMIIDFDKEES